MDGKGTSLLHFHASSLLGNQILVTESYDNMYHCLMLLHQDDDGEAKGAVLTVPCATTHQHISPGKTTFLKFMFMQLISARQVILLCDSTDVRLFYCGQVYPWLMMFGFRNLPKHQGALYFPIWALIDVDYQGQGPPYHKEFKYLAHPDIFSEPHSMEALA